MLNVYKPPGLTPLQTITLLKKKFPDYHDTTISYAGRLDPMAEGVLLLLLGEENKQRAQFESLQKVYNFEVLLGISTDTYDLLGIITGIHKSPVDISFQALEKYVTSLQGTRQQPYPPYSSKPVNGKPLYFWARENRLQEIAIPTKKITITSLSFSSSYSLSPSQLKTEIVNRISRVSGDFRQKEILASWETFFTSPTLPEFTVLKCNVSCSSGTYVRSLANALGEQLRSHALAYSIQRTAVGDYTADKALQLEQIV